MAAIRPKRATPRPFDLHWGRGQIVEEAAHSAEYHEPSMQLLQFEEGYEAVRFCYYDHAGRFQRSPLIVSTSEMEGMRQALEDTPRLRDFLRKLVDE